MDEIIKEVIPFAKDILFYAYKNDLSFPRSCGLVSNILTYFISKTSLPTKYEIHCIRGIFKDIENGEWCDDVNYEIDRYNYKTYDCICHQCGCCDFMNPHSWIELIDKKTKKEYILDFTQIQFTENFPTIHQTILETIWENANDLFDYLSSNVDFFIINDDNDMFQYYIPLEKDISLEKMIKFVEVEQNGSYWGMVENFKEWRKENNYGNN